MSLAEIEFEQKRDLYRLSEMGDMQSARQWTAYTAENPAMARVITKSCKAQDKRRQAISRDAGKFLAKAEKRVLAKSKKPKPRKAKRSPDFIPKSAAWQFNPDAQVIYDEARKMRGGAPDVGDMHVAAYRVALARQMIREELDSPDPLRRMAAWGQS